MMTLENQKDEDENVLTVGIPVFNDPKGVKESIDSVFNQTWHGKKQVLIIDDGSTDQTPAVLNDMQSQYHDILIYRNKKNQGRPYSRNLILEYAKGDYLAWIDAGDIWYPQKLEIQFQTLEKHLSDKKPVICTCPFQWSWIDKKTNDKLRRPVIAGDQLLNVIKGTLYPYLWTMLGPLDSFRIVGGFDERLLRRQDYDFTIRFLEAGGKFIAPAVNEPLCIYLKTDVGRSGKDVTLSNAVIWEKHKSIYRRYGRLFALNIRRRQFILSSRFYKANKKYLYWLKYAALEKILFFLTGRFIKKVLRYFRRKMRFNNSS